MVVMGEAVWLLDVVGVKGLKSAKPEKVMEIEVEAVEKVGWIQVLKVFGSGK